MARPKKEAPNKQGLYEVKVTIGKNFDGTLIRKSFRSKISKADARAKAEQYKINQAVYEQTGENIQEPNAVTFETWANKWLESYKQGTVKQHTYLFTYKSNVEKYLIPYFKKAKLTDIKQIDIQKYFNTVTTDSGDLLAKSTMDKQKMILKSMFDAAIDNDLCYKNPVKNIKYQRVSSTAEKHVYSLEQSEKVIQYAKDSGRIDIVILLETGIRRSELLGLKWADIDFNNNTMHIQRAVTQTKGKIVIDTPKTKTSDRVIPISGDLAEYLEANKNDNSRKVYSEYIFAVSTSQINMYIFVHIFGKYTLTNAHKRRIINIGGGEMKHKDLINLLEKNGWYFKRNGGNHDIYTNGKENEPIPRHKEIKENTAKAIIKRRGLK